MRCTFNCKRKSKVNMFAYISSDGILLKLDFIALAVLADLTQKLKFEIMDYVFNWSIRSADFLTQLFSLQFLQSKNLKILAAKASDDFPYSSKHLWIYGCLTSTVLLTNGLANIAIFIFNYFTCIRYIKRTISMIADVIKMSWEFFLRLRYQGYRLIFANT